MRTPFIVRHPHRPLLAATVVALAMAHPASAHTFCITNAADLQSALTNASDGGLYNGEDNWFRLVQGTYMTGPGGFHYASDATHDVLFTGGYADALCTASLRSGKALQTKLDGHGASAVLSISSRLGDVGVTGLTIQNGESGPGAGLQINHLVVLPGNAVSISDVIIRDNHSSGDAGGLYVAAPYVYLKDVLIADNSADQLYGAGYLTASSDNYALGDYSYVSSSTVTRNTSGAANDPVGGLYVGGNSDWEILRNIFWANTGVGFHVGNDAVDLRDNDYGNIGGMTPHGDILHISQNPQFIDPANGNFHLASGSPVLGYSTYLGLADADLGGNLPPTSGAMDLGAYYETIFADAFEPAF